MTTTRTTTAKYAGLATAGDVVVYGGVFATVTDVTFPRPDVVRLHLDVYGRTETYLMYADETMTVHHDA